MRVLQLIDSLQTGGAERIAVNFANALVGKIEKSYLCSTRQEGLLKESIGNEVNYIFLKKTKTLDFKALKRLKVYIKKNNIDIIHAHSSSYFFAVLLKLSGSKVKIVWHDHYGGSEFLQNRKYKVLRLCSNYFSHIFSVNTILENWAKKYLNANSVSYLPNFALQTESKEKTVLYGKSGKRIIHLANLRPQKDHLTLLDAFNEIVKQYPEWTLHCVGKNFNDDYFYDIEQKIDDLNLNKNVFLYGSKSDITNILKQCDIAVLSSKSEGLPVALLEYGLSKLPVVVTNVGDCSKVVINKENGFIVEKNNYVALSDAISLLIEDTTLASKFKIELYNKVLKEYSNQSVVRLLVSKYQTIINYEK